MGLKTASSTLKVICIDNYVKVTCDLSLEHFLPIIQVHRLAEFVCGDWSEHVSSSGKRYYYNCKTEVSQWEKPKEWNDV